MNALAVTALPLRQSLRQMRRISVIQHARAVRVFAAHPRHARLMMDFQRSNLPLSAASGCAEMRGDSFVIGGHAFKNGGQ
jgi:hypothetical protein